MNEQKEMNDCNGIGKSIPDLIEELAAKYKKKGQEAAWSHEGPLWEQILQKLQSEAGGIKYNYCIEKVLDIGGAAAVFRVIDQNLFVDLDDCDPTPKDLKCRRSYRALNVPRPHLEKGPTLADSLREEISRVISLSHPNVVNIYAKGQIPLSFTTSTTTWPWYIMTYVHRATDLQKLCETAPPHLPQLIHYLYDAARGLQYTHQNGIVHCDVKPGNIFLSEEPDIREQPRAILADFGYAKHVSDQPELTTIGFTDYFAHPELQTGATQAGQGSRTFNKKPRHSIRPAYDLFAFGMTIFYLLENFYKRLSVYSRYSYEMKYLRLCTARLLDGLNHQKAITYAKLPYYCFADAGIQGTDDFVPGIKYRSADELVADFAKLIGESNPVTVIPELIESRRENIQVSDAAPVIYTYRLREIVHHALVRRLASANQLGLLSLVYPGATHSRLEHALGTFGITAKYIMSLYNDTLDPLFKQLVDEDKMKATLLAALLHDIGQYPLAHDLEDISLEFFSHEAFADELLYARVPDLLQKKLFEDSIGQAGDLAVNLANLISARWGIKLSDIRKILSARSSEERKQRQIGSYSERLCKSLIDGPIDADKVDYLLRDSRHCNVQYGYGIDTARLFRCLTVASSDIKDNHLLLVMGVHEKGRISAESILFARYAMLTQVYWHHTMRAIKALLHHATAEFLSHLEPKTFGNKREEFFHCAILEEPISTDKWSEVLRKGEAVRSINAGDLRILGWLWQHTSETGKVAIEHILNRQLFKRLIVVYRSELTEKQRRLLEKVYAPEGYHDRCALREAIEEALLVRLKASVSPPAVLETLGMSEKEWKEHLKDKRKLRCLVDYPSPRSGAAFGLQVVRQWGERPAYTSQESITPVEQYSRLIPNDHFRDGMKELEKSISCLRIYWHPDEYILLKESLGDSDIRGVVMEELNRFTPREQS